MKAVLQKIRQEKTALEKKVDNLQTDFTDFVASQRSFRSTIIIGIPIIISIIVGVIFHFV